MESLYCSALSFSTISSMTLVERVVLSEDDDELGAVDHLCLFLLSTNANSLEFLPDI